jgi:hypothetical protein
LFALLAANEAKAKKANMIRFWLLMLIICWRCVVAQLLDVQHNALMNVYDALGEAFFSFFIFI